jgi:hypothetical protein
MIAKKDIRVQFRYPFGKNVSVYERKSGGGGIRTLGTVFTAHSLSRRAHSTTLAPLLFQISETGSKDTGLQIYIQS